MRTTIRQRSLLTSGQYYKVKIMKKSRKIYIAVCAVMLLLTAVLSVFYSVNEEKNSPKVEPVGRISDEDYLLLNSLEKAPNAENLIFLVEGKDCSFVYGNAGLKKAVKEIAESFADGVIIKSTSLGQKNTTELSAQENEKIEKIVSYFKGKGKAAYVCSSPYLSSEGIFSLASVSSGVVLDLKDVPEGSLASLNKKLAVLKTQLKSKKLYLLADNNCTYLSGLDKKSIDGVFLSLNEKNDAEKFTAVYNEMLTCGINVMPFTDFSLYGNMLSSSSALEAHYEIRGLEKLQARAFLSYSDAKANRDNCFGALRTYITSGIAPVLAFRELKISNDGDDAVPKTKEPVYKVNVKASYLFPINVNGKSLGIFPKGKGEVSLDLKRGKNSFLIEQNGKSDVCEVEYIFEGDIIKSVAPSDKIRVSPGEEIAVMVVAYSEAEVYVKLGATKYPAYKQDGMTGFTAFFAKIKMPADASEIASLGRLYVIASLGEQTQQLEGAEITPVILENTPSFLTTQPQESYIPGVQNFNPTYIDVQQDVLPLINDAISKATTNSYSVPFTGNQMAVVTADYADTKPSNSDSDFIPYFTPLAKGTTDFVIGESQYYDADENETYHYYDLACGLKVNKENVTLQPATNMPENSLRVNSVYGSNGELTIRLSSLWKVPYSMAIASQSYYSSNSRAYYVSEFNATAISLTFHYTTSAYGEIDCSSSEIVSAATWSVSAENQTATLYLPFRQTGVYYGYSLVYEGDETVITIKSRPKGLTGSVVVLDPGHGADDSGARGLSGTVRESDINILVAYQVKSLLESQGVTVYMTRYGDDDINLEGRKIFARTVKPDLFVSIHSNAAENSTSIGTSAFYYKPFSMPLATNIYNELVTVYRDCLYPSRQDLYYEIARGVKYYPFSVTRLDECPSVLIEVGFMTNDNECYMLTQPQVQQLLGQAIANGICRTLTQ